MPIKYSLVSGDKASTTFPATAAGTYTISSLDAGLYEITTDTSQSSFTIAFSDSNGYKFSGTVRGGKGYISIGKAVTNIIVPAGLTYPLNINIRLTSYSLIAAPTSVSSSFPTAGVDQSVTFTAPAGATDIVSYWRNGSTTTFGSTSSPKTSLTNPTITATGQTGYLLLVAKDANGVTGLAVESTTTNTATYFPITGGTITTYSSGGTNYVVNTFTGSGSLVVNTICNITYTVIGGGGGGGSHGGGGAGALLTGTVNSVPIGTYAVTVGTGGSGTNTGARGSNGAASVLNFSSPISAAGGGGGGTYAGVSSAYVSGSNGGCGGGGGMSYQDTQASVLAGGTGSVGGNGGKGQEFQYGQWRGAGGGGGGMSSSGSDTVQGVSGDGGNGNGAGRAGAGGLSINNSIRTGSNVAYCGGGGGRSSNPTYGAAAGGGGGAGNGNINDSLGGAGSANSGSGGGGGAGNGGSGIVIVRTVLS